MNITQKTNTFFREVWVELKRVSWLSRRDIMRYTFIVIAITVVMAGFLGGLDYIFTSVIKMFVLR